MTRNLTNWFVKEKVGFPSDVDLGKRHTSLKVKTIDCLPAVLRSFDSGSDFQKVPAPEPAPAIALELPVITDFLKY
jgi:hypothetical protein